jgi:glycerol kinase
LPLFVLKLVKFIFGVNVTKGFILAIDQGTSGSKAIVFNHSGDIVSFAFREVTQHCRHPGWAEQDANEIWLKTIQAVSDALIGARILPDEIRAIGISNQRCTTVLWDKTTSEPIGRAIVWQDRRSQQNCDRLSASDKAEVVKRTGTLVVPNFSVTKIQWLMEHDRAVKKAIDSGNLVFGTIDSWLIWKLSGGNAHVTDYSNACTAGLLNIQTFTYDDWILDKYRIPPEILPTLKSSSEIYAYTDVQIFGETKIPISGCVGDQSAAVFAQACRKPGMIKNTYGTGSFMILNTGQQRYTPSSGIFSPVLWTLDGMTSYGLEGFADVSGAAIQWLKEGLGIIPELGDVDGLAMQVPDTHGVYFIPAFLGLGAPHYFPNARGSIFGINLKTTKNHIARAALEAIAYQTRDAFECIELAYGRKIPLLRVDGGSAKSDFLMQFQADILGIPVERPMVIEASSQGAAYLAGLAVGYWQSLDEIDGNWKLDTCFEPRISTAKREELYAGWLHAVESVKFWGKRKDPEKFNAQDSRMDHLSPREREVISYTAAGKSAREIASVLFLSRKTVEKHRRNAMLKLGVDNLAELLHICLEIGLIPGS